MRKTVLCTLVIVLGIVSSIEIVDGNRSISGLRASCWGPTTKLRVSMCAANTEVSRC